MAINENSSPNEEDILVLSKDLLDFFVARRTPFGGFKRDNSSRKDSGSRKKDDHFDDKPTSHVNWIKCFECGKPEHIVAK